MVEQPSGSCHDEVRRVSEVSFLLIHARATEDGHESEVCEVFRKVLEHRVALGGQLASWLEHQVPESTNRVGFCLPSADPFFKYGQQVRSSLARTRHGMCQDVITFNDRWNRLSLDHSGVLEFKVLGSLSQRLRDKQLMERDQVFFIVMDARVFLHL